MCGRKETSDIQEGLVRTSMCLIPNVILMEDVRDQVNRMVSMVERLGKGNDEGDVE